MQILVERKPSHANEANILKNELKKYLGLLNLTSVRIVQKYVLEGVSKEQLEEASFKIFAKEEFDRIVEESEISAFKGKVLATKPLETQYNQKADMCVLQLSALFPKSENISALPETIYLFDKIDDSELLRIKKYLINPLETSIIAQNSASRETVPPASEPEIESNFFSLSENELLAFKKNHGISMINENLAFVQDYFKKEGRTPTITELKILDTYWSDHCRHSTFLTVLDEIKVEESHYQEGFLSAQRKYEEVFKTVYQKERPQCLMDMATLEMKRMKLAGELGDLEKSDEVNACSVEISAKVDGKDEDFILMFKNETHNHPTEIEPFGGAATCIGGGIRDPLSGRSHVFGAMRITGSGDPREAFDDTMEGKLSQRKITKTAADGYSSYANQIGLASTHLAEYYDAGFKAKRMECGALVAYNFKKNIIRENGTEGDVVILVGGKTGRDGLGGATGSSDVQAGGASAYSAEVQKGNPLLERSIVRLFRKPEISRIIKKCNDFGAGGVSVAIGELADGLYIHLDKVTQKLDGMTATEVAISESQERMAVVIDQKNADFFISEARKENLEARTVAEINNSARMIMEHKGKIVCNLESEFLNSGGVRQRTKVLVEAPGFLEKNKAMTGLKEGLLNSFRDLNLCTKEPIARQFDKTVGAATAFYPFGGKNRITPEQGLAMRIPLEAGETNLGTIMTVGYDPKSCYESPFHAAMFAVAESILKAVSMGGNLATIRLSFQEYFERMNTAKSWGKVYSALLGAFAVQNELRVPSIGGKDSMSGTYEDISVPPSLLSFAMAPCDVTKLISRSFKKDGNRVYLLKTKLLEDKTIDFHSLRENIKFLEKENGDILSSSVVGAGGIANAVFEMCLGNGFGFIFAEDLEENIFEKSYVNVLLESKEALALPLVGEITLNQELRLRAEIIPLDELKHAWSEPLNEIFGKPLKDSQLIKTEQKQDIHALSKLSNPRPEVTILVLPGTVGEYTVKRLYEKAGAAVNTHVFDILDFPNGYQRFADEIRETDILVFPSGMTAGGEPNSAGSLLNIILSEDSVMREVNSLIERGGLILGFGESFSSIIDSGLIEHGKISQKTDSLVIEKNPHAKFYSGLLRLDSLGSVTPWIKSGDFIKRFAPLALMEGKLSVSEADYKKYAGGGQITLTFADENPLHSGFSIAAMTSQNGKIFASLADLSLLEEGLYQNVTDAKEAEIFKRSVSFIRGKGGD